MIILENPFYSVFIIDELSNSIGYVSFVINIPKINILFTDLLNFDDFFSILKVFIDFSAKKWLKLAFTIKNQVKLLLIYKITKMPYILY